MTKTEFALEAPKAGLRTELYGAVLSGTLYSDCGPISGAKVVGIEWRNAWKTEREYSYLMGEQEKTFLAKAAYVILAKNRRKYRVEAYRDNQYVEKLLGNCLAEKVKCREPL